jgi:beta-mannosidase
MKFLSGLMIIFFVLSAFELKASDTLQLADGWHLRNAANTISLPVVVPGNIHTDLLGGGIIEDPFYRDKARYLGWVDTTTWIYETAIRWPAWSCPDLELHFEGLDTYADIYINDIKVKEVDNMFIHWRIPLMKPLDADSIRIMVVLHPAIQVGLERSKAVPFTYPADSDAYPGKPSVFTRKAAYQFGWDFAPALPGGGIWRPVYIHCHGNPEFSEVWVETVALEGDKALLRIHGHLLNSPIDTTSMIWQLGMKSGRFPVVVESDHQYFTAEITVDSPSLWWPNGNGTPYLYDFTLSTATESDTLSVSFPVGIRTIELDRSEDSQGRAFQFIINGKPLFMQGANWVPVDCFPSRVDDEKYRSLMGLAAEAGMNMMRVWGGGYYEDPLFYHLADSLGLVIWQDFMFAGTMYPADSVFVNSVVEEASQQIKRLRRHPSVGLWCGNNEIEVAWKNWGWQLKYGYSAEQITQMEAEYALLFDRVLPQQVAMHHPGISYLGSSPTNNWGLKSDLNYGNNHFWGIWHGEMALDSLSTWIPRFMSEFGMQSFPTMESIHQFSIPSDFDAQSEVMKFHQKSYKGNQLISKYIKMESLEPAEDFPSFVARSHHLQVLALEKGITAHQAAYPFCMGTLIWQFNEPWPGASWSVIDYYGRPKPAYFKLKELFNRKDLKY